MSSEFLFFVLPRLIFHYFLQNFCQLNLAKSQILIDHFLWFFYMMKLQYTIQVSYDTHFKTTIQKNLKYRTAVTSSRFCAGPNLKYYYLARVCTTSGKPSTRLPLGGHVELKPPIFWNIWIKIFTFWHFSIFQYFFAIFSTNWDLLYRNI